MIGRTFKAAGGRSLPPAPSRERVRDVGASAAQVLGNRQMQGLLRSGTVRASLRVSQPDDPLEQEADRVAARITGGGTAVVDPAVSAPTVQRMCGECEEEQLQRKASRAAGDRTDGSAAALSSALTRGQPLTPSSRSFFEPRLGRGLGDVRVHTDATAGTLADSIGARAFTLGTHVAFAPGEFAPETAAGRQLLAHELVHVVQGGPAVQRSVDPATCDVALVEPAIAMAGTWLGAVARWFTAHLSQLRARAGTVGENGGAIGGTAFEQLRLLDRHFRIRDEVRRQGSLLPVSAGDRVTVADIEALGRASFEIRRHFEAVRPESVDFVCGPVAPRNARGHEVWGRTQAGSRLTTLFMDAFRERLDPIARAAVVLHEAFHAWSTDFDHDTYSYDRDVYPGPAPLTNADSYATFASIVATGSTYRIVRLAPVEIQGVP